EAKEGAQPKSQTGHQGWGPGMLPLLHGLVAQLSHLGRHPVADLVVPRSQVANESCHAGGVQPLYRITLAIRQPLVDLSWRTKVTSADGGGQQAGVQGLPFGKRLPRGQDRPPRRVGAALLGVAVETSTS